MTTTAAGRRGRVEAGEVQIVDYARPFHSVTTDYENLIVILARDSVPAALLALEPHGLVFPLGSGAARLIGAAMQELYAQAGLLTVSEAEAAIEGIVALTTAFARARLVNDEADHVKSRRKTALDYIEAHLANEKLGPDEIADAVHVSRASLYRLLAAEGGIRAVLLTRRLDEALRLLLADNKDERSLTEVAKRCGFGGASQFSRRSARASACRRGDIAHSSASRISTGTKRGSRPTASTGIPCSGGTGDRTDRIHPLALIERRAWRAIERLRLTRLDQFQPLEARVAVLADDDVIVHGNAERVRNIDDRLRHLDGSSCGRDRRFGSFATISPKHIGARQ